MSAEKNPDTKNLSEANLMGLEGQRVEVDYHPDGKNWKEGTFVGIRKFDNSTDFLFSFPGAKGHDGPGIYAHRMVAGYDKEALVDGIRNRTLWWLNMNNHFKVPPKKPAWVPYDRNGKSLEQQFEELRVSRIRCNYFPPYDDPREEFREGEVVGKDAYNLLVRYTGETRGHSGFGQTKGIPKNCRECWYVTGAATIEVFTDAALPSGITPDTGVHPGVVRVAWNVREEFKEE